jgi:hypothetical protein
MNPSIKEIACPRCGKPYILEANRWKEEVVCSNCKTKITVATTAEMTAANTMPLPPHLQGTAASLMPPAVGNPEPVANTGAVVPPIQPAAGVAPPPQMGASNAAPKSPARSKSGNNWVGTLVACVLLMLGIVVITVFVFAIASNINLTDDSHVAKPEKKQKRPAAEINFDKITWANAKTESSKLDKIIIKIPMIQFSEIRAKDSSHGVLISKGTNYLQVFIEMRNRGGDKQYESWFQDPGEEFERLPKLFDQDHNELPMMLFDDAASVQGHVRQATFEADSELNDMIVFDLPEGKSIESIQSLYLVLPGSAVRENRKAYFKIPAEMIRRPGNPAGSGLTESTMSKE